MNKGPKREPIRSQGGFTLVEVMIAVAVLSIGLLSIASMQTSSTIGNTAAWGISSAVMVAQDQTEKIATMDFDDDDLSDGNGATAGEAGLDDNPDDADNPAEPDYRDPNNPIDGKYYVYWNVATGVPLPDTTSSGTKTIRVIVTWSDKMAADRHVSVDYIMADKF